MITDDVELARLHARQAAKAGVRVHPVVLYTGWDVGPVIAFLFADDPVTLIDAGFDSERSCTELEAAFRAAGRRPEELRRLIVTHGHSDHVGGARYLQDLSGCEVLMHRDDEPTSDEERAQVRARMMHSLGFTPEAVERFFGRRSQTRWRRRFPSFTWLHGGEVVEAGASGLRIEHHPGHSPGHVWAIDSATGAVFSGDYLLATAPTNAGLEPEPDDPSRRRPMLSMYERGLEALAGLDTPVVFPSHGAPVTGHADLIARRLDKSHRRTEHVRRVVERGGGGTAFDVTYRMYGERMARNAFDILADVTGRLDLLAARGDTDAVVDPEGVWRFAPATRLDSGMPNR